MSAVEAEATVDVAEFIDRRPVGRFQLGVLALCFLVMIIDGFDAQSIGFVAPLLSSAWHVAKPAFGPVFAAGLLGMALGALLFGALADRFGRKRMIVLCMAMLGLLTLAKVLAGSVASLAALQFLAGLGVGGVMPNTISLMSEYSPSRSRALLVTIASCGYSVGASGAGLLTAGLADRFGWTAMFYLGGVVALAAVPLLALAMPESIRLLVLHRSRGEHLARILGKIDPGVPLGGRVTLVSSEERVAGVPVLHLFREGRTAKTLLLWTAVFMDLVVIYYMTSWLPAMLHEAGISIERASATAALFSAAGIVGTPVVGRLMDRLGAFRMLALAFCLAAVSIMLIGPARGSYLLLNLVIFMAGFWTIGGHLGISALAGELYPTFMRATGVGWALGMGRFCSLVSPVLGGMLLAWHWGLSPIFIAVGVPAAAAAGAILLIGLVDRRDAAREMPAVLQRT